SKPALDRAADREKVAWLIHPADLPATPDAANPLADPGAELRIETDRAAANWLFEKRYLAVSREMTQLPGKPAAAVRLGEAISKAVQPLAGWPR
ncbi:MAG TPA: hypothetical protein VM597_08760, partial [Gemmataceae bacterium]|nr:hypothetical protein [Gemmataceae bacterium]